MATRPAVQVTLGALLSIAVGVAGGTLRDGHVVEDLSGKAQTAISDAGGRGVRADFTGLGGWPTRHPLLDGGDRLDDKIRANVARAVAGIPGVGGVHWADGSIRAQASEPQFQPLHCQEDVEALLRARTVRFEESSTRLDRASRDLIDEVAAALRPCLGSIIAITGHTDNLGPEPGNIALSQDRADAVRRALMQRGIPADGLRARGVGSKMPVAGLDPADPANRRIEFSVIATEPLVPTPIDTPGAR